MAVCIPFQKITKYLVTAECTQPLHIGNALGDKEEVLIHPVDDVPFIQAASIAGVLRGYCALSHSREDVDGLFGAERSASGENSARNGSRLRISDGKFCDKSPVLELRPRVSIDPKTGSCEASTIKGTENKAGHKFNMEYIGAGAKFEFTMYLYGDSGQGKQEKQEDHEKREDQEKVLEEILAAIHREKVQFGGQKSNGCGYMNLVSVKKKVFYMTSAKDRELWSTEDKMGDMEYTDILPVIESETAADRTEAYEITVKGCTEGNLLVKSIAVPDYGKNAPDCMNLRNAAGNYIVPGSSLKGAVRSQMEKIAGYLGREEIIRDTFGYTGDLGKNGKAGNIVFHDTVVGSKTDNDKADLLSYRIHIDKFTGGVMDGGLFCEKNVSGDLNIRISIKNRNHPERTCGLLLLALRDLAIGVMNIGSGYNVGKGIIDVREIIVKDMGNGQEAVIHFKKNEAEGYGITDETKLILQCIQAVQREVAAV